MTDTHIDGRVDPTGAEGDGTTLTTAVSDHAQQLTHHAGDELGSVVDTAKEQTRGVIDEARSRAADEADAMTSRAAEALSGTAKDLRDLATGHSSPDTQVAGLARQAGEGIDRVAVQLRERGYQGLTDDVTRWARAHPGAFLGIAVGAGFVIGRVFRAADTRAVAEAAKGSASNVESDGWSDTPPELSSGNAGLPAGEQDTPAFRGSPGPTSAPRASEPSIDLTDPRRSPVWGCDVALEETSYRPRPAPIDSTGRAMRANGASRVDSDGRESLGDLIAATTRDLSALVRTEVELAKTEIKEEVADAGHAGALIGAGALLGYLAVLLLLLSAAWAIAEAIGPWAGLLIMGVATAAVAAVLIIVGRKKLGEVQAVPNTIQSLQEDVQWAKQQLS